MKSNGEFSSHRPKRGLYTTLFCLSFFLNVNIHSICITSIKILCNVRLILQCIFGNVHKWITKLTHYQLFHIVLVKKYQAQFTNQSDNQATNPCHTLTACRIRNYSSFCSVFKYTKYININK